MAKPDDPRGDLQQALRDLRAAVAELRYPLSLPSGETASALAASVCAQLDDYLLPRLANPAAPLLVAVGGPTGAGKSTLVNSLIRAPASAAGVLRPTTRAPVLMCHPGDATWFRSRALLGGLTRTSGPTDDLGQLQLVTAPALDTGCAFLDTPDVDSTVGPSREAARHLLAAADLWLFAVTAARYADAVPWDLLATARARGTTIALVLNRVPESATDEVVAHLQEMLAARDLAGVSLFVVPEARADGHGLLPETLVQPLRAWFQQLAADPAARAEVVRRTCEGAIAALPTTAEVLASAVEDQVAAAEVLAEQAGMAYGAARSAVDRSIADGALLRGQVFARWQEFVATGEWLRSPLAAVARVRDRLTIAFTRPGGASAALASAVESSLVSLVRSVAVDASDQIHAAWHAHVGDAPLLSDGRSIRSERDDDQSATLIGQWREDVGELVRSEVAAMAGRAGYVDATTATVLVAASAPATPPEVGSVTDREVLAAALDDDTVRSLASKAREDLLDRVAVLLDAEAARHLDRLAGSSLDPTSAQRLREAAVRVDGARAALDDPERTSDHAGEGSADPALVEAEAPDEPADPGPPDPETSDGDASPRAPEATR